MENNIKKLIKSLDTGKNVEESLREYMDFLTGHYNEISLLNLTMNAVILYEKMMEGEQEITGPVRLLYEQVNDLIAGIFVYNKRPEEILKKLLEQRKRIAGGMQELTLYIDKLKNYEYVLNRKELSFESAVEIKDEAAFVNRVLQYLFGSRDNALINERIKEILGQLPVRMARSRYFDLIRESYSSYQDSDRSALDTYDYMLRTCAMIYEPEETEEAFRELKAFTDELGRENFDALEKGRFDELTGKLKVQAEALVLISDLYAGLEEAVNDLYAYILALPYGGESSSEAALACREILQSAAGLVKEGGLSPIPGEIMDKLHKTEGGLEALQYTRDMLEAALPKVRQSYGSLAEELSLGEQLADLARMERLLSTSLFMEPDAAAEKTVTPDYVREKTGEMLRDLENSFKGRPRCVNRAVIANTINKMPVFFQTAEETADYIRVTLEQCRDAGEKAVSMKLIEELIEEGEAF